MDAPRDRLDGRSTPAAAWVALAALAALGLWLRLRAVPGPWGTDALGYAERALGGVGALADTRSQRVLFGDLVRLGFGLTGGSPAGASLPGIALSALVGPVLFVAARRLAGPWLALLPAAVWAVLGLDVEEVVEISADAATALPAALAALALVAATQRPRQAVRWLVLGGVAAGVASLLKETGVFAAAALVAGALCCGTGRRRLAHAGAAALAVGATIAVAALAGVLPRPGVAAHEAQFMHAPIAWDAPGFLARVTLGVPRVLLTATGAFGLLHVAALPLIARLPIRAARGRALAVAALAGLLAFDVCPVTLGSWSVLPATFPRYLVPVLPFWLLSLTDALADDAPSASERRAAVAGAVLGLAFVGRSPATWFLLPPALLLLAVPWSTCQLPGSEGRGRTGEGPQVDSLTTGRLRRLLPAPHARALAATALVAAAAAAFATPWARTRPDPTWRAWDVLPPAGAVHADRLVGRRLAIAARTSPGADASRLRLLDDDLPPPDALAPGDVVLVRRGTKLAAAAAARDDLHAATDDLGETLLLRR